MALPVEVLSLASSSRTFPKGTHFPLSFFTPTVFCKGKGKERSRDNSYPFPCTSNSYSQWSQSSRYPICVTDEECRTASRIMTHEFITKWDPPPIRSSRLPGAIHPRTPQLSPPIIFSQKRHSSNSSDHTHSSSSLPSIADIRAALTAEMSRRGWDFQFDVAFKAFQDAQDANILHKFNTNTLLVLVMKMIIEAEKNLYNVESELEILVEHSGKIMQVLESFRPRLLHSSNFHLRFLTLESRALSLGGNFTDSTSILRDAFQLPFIYEKQGRIWESFKPLLVAMWRYKGVGPVFNYVVEQWSYIGSFLVQDAVDTHHSSPALFGKSLRSVTFSLLHVIDDPGAMLASRKPFWSDRQMAIAANLLVETYLFKFLPLDAYSVLQYMDSISRPLSLHTAFRVVGGLARQDDFRAANILFASLPKDDESSQFLSTGLHLVARQGNSEAAHKYFNRLAAKDGPRQGDIVNLMHSYATNGDVEEVSRLFSRFFPIQPDGRRHPTPALTNWNVMLYAFATRGDIGGMNMCLTRMKGYDQIADIYTYNIVLKGLALRGDMDAIAAVFQQMRDESIKPDLVSYTTVITVLAMRRNPQAAEYIFRRAVAEGVSPDRRMFSAIMHAHVEAGSWKGVIRVFDFLRTSPQRLIALTVSEYNLVLRAYLYIGAPFFLLARLFAKMEQFKLIPNQVTYSLMIQSASESDLMDLASGIFQELVALERKEGKNTLITAGMYTMIMSGFIRKSQFQEAKMVYNQMLARGLQPNAVTYSHILRGYASAKTVWSIHVTEDFLEKLVSGPAKDRPWDRPYYGRSSALSLIYTPVLREFAQKKKTSVDHALRLYRQYVELGGEPDLGILTNVLLAHRNALDADSAAQVWSQIYELAKMTSNHVRLFPDDPVITSQPSSRTDIIAIPLSICIDALSAGGQHEEVARVWREYQADGFVFTGHNWNHLIVALIRAGDVTRAVAVIQKVILPYRRLASEEHSKDRDMEPTSALTFEVGEDDEYEYDEPSATSSDPMSNPGRRRKTRAHSNFIAHAATQPGEERQDDFVHPLYLMHQLSPAWNHWRVHYHSRKAILLGLERLRTGRTVPPVLPMDAPLPPPLSPEEMHRDKQTASYTLDNLHDEYQDAMAYLHKFEEVERKRRKGQYQQEYQQESIW